MKVLIACEYSATVRDAFRAQGHDAWSCDLLPTEGDPQWHIQDDIFHVLCGTRHFATWDLMIAHPPCTYLTYAGAKHLYVEGRKENGRDPARWEALNDGALFFRALLRAPIERIAVENPIMLAEARKIVGSRADQIIQPWQFGHPESKRTGLWLRGLPPLTPTHDLEAEMLARPRKDRDRIHYIGPGPTDGKSAAGPTPALPRPWRYSGAPRTGNRTKHLFLEKPHERLLSPARRAGMGDRRRLARRKGEAGLGLRTRASERRS